MKINILATVLVIGGGIAIGVAVPAISSTKTSGVAVDEDRLKQSIRQEYKEELIRTFIEDYEIEQLKKLKYQYESNNENSQSPKDLSGLTLSQKEALVDYFMKGSEASSSIAPAHSSTQTPQGTQSTQGNPGTEATPSPTAPTPSPGTSAPVIKDPWLQEVIDEKKDLIKEADLASGAEIYNKLDMEYLFSLAEGGLTEGKKKKVQAYLSSMLSPEENKRAMDLYLKYVGLLGTGGEP